MRIDIQTVTPGASRDFLVTGRTPERRVNGVKGKATRLGSGVPQHRHPGKTLTQRAEKKRLRTVRGGIGERETGGVEGTIYER